MNRRRFAKVAALAAAGFALRPGQRARDFTKPIYYACPLKGGRGETTGPVSLRTALRLGKEMETSMVVEFLPEDQKKNSHVLLDGEVIAIFKGWKLPHPLFDFTLGKKVKI